jgi:hypothetical protein
LVERKDDKGQDTFDISDWWTQLLTTWSSLYHLQFNFRYRSEVVLRLTLHWLHTVIDVVST